MTKFIIAVIICKDFYQVIKLQKVKFKIYSSILLGVCMLCMSAACGSEAHKLEEVKAIEPDCTQAGLTAHWRCIDCGKTFLDKEAKFPVEDVTLPQLEHDYILTASTPADCENDGEEILHCSMCADEIRRELPASGHVYQVYVTKRPKSDEPGERVRVCLFCGDRKSEIIPAIS